MKKKQIKFIAWKLHCIKREALAALGRRGVFVEFNNCAYSDECEFLNSAIQLSNLKFKLPQKVNQYTSIIECFPELRKKCREVEIALTEAHKESDFICTQKKIEFELEIYNILKRLEQDEGDGSNVAEIMIKFDQFCNAKPIEPIVIVIDTEFNED